MINFTAGAANILAACKAAEVDTIVTSRAFVEKGKLDAVVEQLAHRRPRSSISKTCARPSAPATSCAALFALQEAAGRAQAGRSGRDPVHLRLGRHAEGRRAVPPQHAGELRAGRRAHRLRPSRQAVQRAAGVPLLRPDGRHDPAAGLGRADLSLSLAAALSHRAGADLRRERHHRVRHRHVPRRLCALRASLRLPLAALHRRRRRAGARSRRAAPTWRSSACASSKAMA